MRNLNLNLVITGDDKGLTATVDRASGSLDEFSDSAKRADTSIDGMGSTLRNLVPAVTAAGAAMAAWEAAKIADQFNILDQRIKTATQSTGDYVSVSQRLFELSQRTGTALETNVEMFQGIARAAEELGATSDDVLTLVETLNRLGQIGGATAQQMSDSMLQFTQAIGGGVIQAEEFNSILDGTPEIAARIAEGMGMTTSELRAAVKEGQVLSQDVFNSLMSQAGSIATEFEAIPRTLEQATTALGNSMDRFIASLDESIGLSSKLAGIFDAISAQLDRMSDPLRNLNVELRQASQEIRAIEDRQAYYERAGGLINKWLIGDKGEALQSLEEVRAKIEETGAVLERFAEPSEDLDTVIDQMSRYESTISEATETTEKAVKQTDKAATSVRKFGGAAKDTSRELEQLERTIQGYLDELNGVTAAEREYLEAVENVNEALQAGIITADDAAAVLANMENELNGIAKGSAQAAEELAGMEGSAASSASSADPWASAWDRAVKSIDQSFADLWRSSFSGFKDFAESLKNAFLNLLAELAHAAITRPIVMTVLGQFTGIGGAAAAMGGAGGVAGAAAGGVGGFGGIGSFFTGTSIGTGLANTGFNVATGLGMGPDAAANLFGGMSTVPNWAFGAGALGGGLLGGMVFGDSQYGGIGSNIGSSVGSAIGSVFGTVGTVVGGLLGGLLGGLTGSLFGDKTDPRIQLITQGGAGHEGFEDNVYERTPLGTIGLGEKSHKVDAEEFRPIFQAVEEVDRIIADFIGEEAVRRIEDYLDNLRMGKFYGWASETYYDATEGNIGEAVGQRWAALLGAGGTEFSDVLSRFAQRLDGTAEEVITQMADYAAAVKTIEISMEDALGIFGPKGFTPGGLTEAVTWLEEQARAGEALSETFLRLNMSLESVTRIIDAFGLQVDLAGKDLIIMSQAVIDAFPGGQEEFQAKTASYYDYFYTPQERAQRSFEQARDDIIRLNAALGVTGGDLIDTKGELRALVEALDLTTEAGRDAFVSAMDLAQAIIMQDEATKILTQDIQALEAQIAQIPGVIDAFGRSIDAIRRGVELSGLAGEERYNYISGEIDQRMLALATASSLEEFSRIVQEINQLITEAWSGLGEEEQAEMKQAFLGFLDEYQAYVEKQATRLEERLTEEKTMLEAEREAAENNRIAAETQRQAAELMIAAAQQMAAAAANMPSQFTVAIAGGEVG